MSNISVNEMPTEIIYCCWGWGLGGILGSLSKNFWGYVNRNNICIVGIWWGDMSIKIIYVFERT
jgi:hypothetical protein